MKSPTFFRRQAAIVFAVSLLPLPTMTAQGAKKIDWAGDLKFFEAEFPKAHIDPFHTLKREEFHQMVSSLIASASQDTDRQMVAGLMRITAAIGDSHSGIHSIPANLRFAIVPVSVYLFGDQLGIVAGAPEYSDLIGGKIISINGHPVKEVVQQMKLLTEGTNDMTRSAFVVTRLIRPELLFYEGFAKRPDQYDLVVQKDGKTIAHSLTVLGRKPDGSPITGGMSITPLPLPGSGWVSATPKELPLWLQNMDKQFWVAELPARSALYIHDKLVLDEKDGQSFGSFFRDMFKKIEQGQYKTIVLDIRLNGGGDNTLFEPLEESFKFMPAFQTKGRFFVITGRLTQSAAQNFTTFLERNTKAIFVGEPTGESPNHYGDPDPIELPSSGISINLSRKRWNDSSPRDHRPWTQPTISVPLTLDDFRKGHDPALEAIWEKCDK
jgi:hypothetical protein